MPTTDPRIDAYIEQAEPFARPVLAHLRAVVHRHCPEVVETLKWGMPYFEHHGLLCHMAAFKRHCAFGFRHPAMQAAAGDGAKAAEAMGQFGRIASLSDLPDAAALGAMVEQAVRLNREGVKAAPQARPAKPPLEVPAELLQALAQVPQAQAVFEGLAPSHRREYVAWIVEAKAEATRQRRVAQAVAKLAEGKKRT